MSELSIPTGTLILVGDGAKALFLRNKGTPSHLELSVERVLGQPDEPTREQGTDRPGRYQGGGTPRSAFEQTDWHRLSEERFAADIGGALNRLAQSGGFQHLILVAPPKALGDLRHKLHKEVTEKILSELHKDLTSHTVADIAKALSS
jgi:protein required for attachment to host cells